MSDIEYKRIFSRNLKKYMTLNNKEQIDLINDLGFNKSAVSTWCNGTRLPRMDKVQALANYFGIEKSDLIEDKPKGEVLNWTDNLTKDNADLIPDLLSDSVLMEHVRKLVDLNSEHKQTIYDNITYWHEKEGR